MKRSLWIFKQYAVPPEIPGNTRHFELGRRLAEYGYEVTIIATSFNYSQYQEMRLEPGQKWKLEKIDNVNFVWIKTTPFYGNDWRRAVHMLSYMYRSLIEGKKLDKLTNEIKRPDLILGCSVPPFAALAAYWLSKYYKSDFFFEVGDLWPEALIEMGYLTRKNPITRGLQVLERFLYQHGKKIITPLPSANKYIEQYDIPKNKVVWIPNGVDTKVYKSSLNDRNNQNKFTVMYLGAHSNMAALDTVIYAAKILQTKKYNDIEIVLMGDGPEKPKLQELVKKLQLNNVNFYEPVPKSTVPNVLSKAAIVIFSFKNVPINRKYGIGSKKLFEYLAVGVPVIFAAETTKNPVEEANCGISVPPGNPESMAEAILQIYNLPESERSAMGQRGIEHAEKNYEWSVLAERLSECFNS